MSPLRPSLPFRKDSLQGLPELASEGQIRGVEGEGGALKSSKSQPDGSGGGRGQEPCDQNKGTQGESFRFWGELHASRC